MDEVLGKAFLKDACKGLLREQHEQEAKKVAGPLTWRHETLSEATNKLNMLISSQF